MGEREKYGFRWLCSSCHSGSGSHNVAQALADIGEGVTARVDLSAVAQQLQDFKSEVTSKLDVLEASVTPVITPPQFSDILKRTLSDRDANKVGSEGVKISTHGKPKTILPQEVLLLQPKSGATIDQVKTDAAKTTVELALKSIPVDSCRKTKNGGLVVKFPSKEFKDRASSAIERQLGQDSDFSVSKPMKIKPKMTITGVPNTFPDKEIVDSIVGKSPEIRELIDKGLTMELVFTKEKGQYKHAVVRMSPEIRASISKQGGRVYVGLSSCRAYDRFWVTQCFHCQKFGHKYADCPKKHEQPTCTFCAGHHESRSCTNKSSLCCVNCSSAGGDNANAAHSSSSEDCPTMVAECQRLIERTDLSG